MTSRNENVRALMILFRSEKMVDLFFDANRHLTMFLRAEKGFYGITLVLSTRLNQFEPRPQTSSAIFATGISVAVPKCSRRPPSSTG